MISAIVFGQFHEDVYRGEEGAQLITKLRVDFRPATVLSYGDARELMYTRLYNRNDSVTCVYSGHRLYLDPGSQNPIGDLIQNGDANGINCEHTFPQSKGAGSGNPRSDMHHLFPSRARVNEARLNYPFAEVEDRNTELWFKDDIQQSGIPQSDIDEYSELGDEIFEPREDHKGNVARAIFYFYTVYRSVADASFFSDQRTTLCDWHYLDPVDSLEWFNNIEISERQDGKRNPFILDCSLVERTYCPDVADRCQTSSNESINLINANTFPNPSLGHFSIVSERMTGTQKLLIHDLMGRKVSEQSIDLTDGNADIVLDNHIGGGYYSLTILDADSGKIMYRDHLIVSQ